MGDGDRRRGRGALGAGPRGQSGQGDPGSQNSRDSEGGQSSQRGQDSQRSRHGGRAADSVAQGVGRQGGAAPGEWDEYADNPRGRVHAWDLYRTPRQYDGRPPETGRPGEYALSGPETLPGAVPDTRDVADLPDPRGPRRPRPPLMVPGSGAPYRRPRTRGPVFIGRVLLCAASAAVILASGLTWAAYHDLTAGLTTSSALSSLKPGEKGYVRPRLDGSVNLLLIGLDSRKDMDGNDLPTQFVEDELHAGSSGIGGYNTNVLIFLHIPADGGRVTAFSIARDDFVEEPGGESSVGTIPDLGMHKIKEAYGRAKAIAVQRLKARGVTGQAAIEAQSREVGRESTIRAVQLLTGERVDHFAEINLLGFYDIAKAVGPIEVCLNHAVSDPIENGAGTGLHLPAGHSELDAAQALQFVRQRYHLARGDFDRNRRQQAFLSAVVAKLRGQGVIGDLGRMQALMDVVKKDIVIDDGWDVLDFAQRAQNLTSGDAVFNELPITGQPVLPDDGSVNTVDPARIRGIVMTAFGDGKLLASQQAPDASGDAAAAPTTSDPASHDAVVDVYNASGRTGQAAGAAKVLGAAGWLVSGVMNAPVQANSTVYYGPGAEKEADQLAAKLGLSATPQASTRASARRVVVYLGTDYVSPASAAAPSAAATDGGDANAAGVDGSANVNGNANDSASSGNGGTGASGDFNGPTGADGPSPGATSAPASGGIAMSDGVTCVN